MMLPVLAALVLGRDPESPVLLDLRTVKLPLDLGSARRGDFRVGHTKWVPDLIDVSSDHEG